MDRTELLQRAENLNVKLGKTLLGPDWTPEEEVLLRKLSNLGYDTAKDVEDILRALEPIVRTSRSDQRKMRVLDAIQKQVNLAVMACNQVGYDARSAYDQRW